MPVEIITENTQIVKAIKNALQEGNILDKAQKIARKGNKICLCSRGSLEVTRETLKGFTKEITLRDIENEKTETEDTSFRGLAKQFLRERVMSESTLEVPSLAGKLPKKWSLYPPMVLFNTGSFDSPPWSHAFQTSIRKDQFFEFVSAAFPGKITHAAINKPIIEEDAMRRPFNLVPLWGDFGPEPTPQLFSIPGPSDLGKAFWCTAHQNGIHQTWAPRYTMFSRGNIKEKKRILDSITHLEGKSVLDLYAGIGYFTLSYLANGATVFCWEINPWSIEGLMRGLEKNGHMYKIFEHDEAVSQSDIAMLISKGYRAFVFKESNEHCLQRLAEMKLTEISHINLGLLPSSKPSWPIARTVSKARGLQTIVHVHENVHKNDFSKLIEELEVFFEGSVTQLEKVKSFAPDVWHVVLDVAI